jgi:hypothetical protein
LSDICPIKGYPRQRDAALPLIFNFALEYTIRGVKEEDGRFSFCSIVLTIYWEKIKRKQSKPLQLY